MLFLFKLNTDIELKLFLIFQWMYIIPGVLIVILSSATNPEAGGPGGGAAPRQ